jgi:hypothetical protein
VLIRQPDHARLAARLVAGWQDGGLPANPRRDTILAATAAHDDGWIDEDAAPWVSADGRPVDFITAELAVKQRVWPRVVTSLAPDHPYAAALVAQHALTVYVDHQGKPEWRAFFAGMADLRTANLARCDDASAAAIDQDYRFVRMGDILSLIFCGGWRQPYEHDARLIERHGDVLTVAPDPFAGRPVDIALEARRIPRRPYRSDAELRAACTAAPIEWLRGTATGRS